jgi:2'-5' RNA ligase
VGRLFHSFDESWAQFIARDEPLENFVGGLPQDPRVAVAVWLVPVSAEGRRGLVRVRERLGRFDWLRPLPDHFLHVTVAGLGFVEPETDVSGLVEGGRERLRGLAPFRLTFPRLNCFHEAVVAEAEGDGLHEAARRLRGDVGLFLPHLSLAYTTAPGPPDELRKALLPIRDTPLGAQDVREIQLCVVPASRTTILEPWTVAGRVCVKLESK